MRLRSRLGVRSLHGHAGSTGRPRRTFLLLLAGLAAQIAVAPQAHAVIARTGAGHYVSYQPTRSQAARARNLTRLPAGTPIRTSPPRAAGTYKQCGGTGACLSYFGGPVMHTTTVIPIFWDPEGALTYPVKYKEEIEQFITAVAVDSSKGTNFFSVLTQYYDLVGGEASFVNYSVTAGAPQNDTDSLPSGAGDKCTDPFSPSRPCVSDLGVKTELLAYVKAHPLLPTGIGHEYVVFFPPGLDSCFAESGEGSTACSGTEYCGYHGSLNPNKPEEIEYANEPDNADPAYGNACLPISGLKAGYATTDSTSHEISESVTDPQVGAPLKSEEVLSWYDQNSLVFEFKGEPAEQEYAEIGDMCAYEYQQGDGALEVLAKEGFNDVPLSKSNQTIDGHPYLLQLEWDNAHSTCSLSAQAASSDSAFSDSATSKTLTGEPVSFDASASHGPSDPRVSISGYQWSWGDGTSTFSSTPTASHSFASTGAEPTGNFEVTLTVIESNGNSVNTTKTLRIGDRPPSAAFSPPTATAGIATQFDGSHSSDPDGGVTSYSWSFGDGNSGSGEEAAHVYSKAGSYPVKLTVTDAAGLSASTEWAVTVTAPSNKIKITGSKANRKTGTVTLSILVPGAGRLGARDATSARGSGLLAALERTLASRSKHGKGKKAVILVKSVHRTAAGAEAVTLTIAPTSAGKARLRGKRSLSVGLVLEFTPTDGTVGTTSANVRLALQSKKRR
jgi:PKD repeat protein